MTLIGVLPGTIPAMGLALIAAGGDLSVRFLAMIILAVLGITLIFTATWIARVVAGKRADPKALSRVLQIAGVILLLSALAVRPHNPETAVFPPPPDAPAPASGAGR